MPSESAKRRYERFLSRRGLSSARVSKSLETRVSASEGILRGERHARA